MLRKIGAAILLLMITQNERRPEQTWASHDSEQSLALQDDVVPMQRAKILHEHFEVGCTIAVHVAL